MERYCGFFGASAMHVAGALVFGVPPAIQPGITGQGARFIVIQRGAEIVGADFEDATCKLRDTSRVAGVEGS